MSTEVQTRTAFPYSAIVLVITTFPDGTRAAGTGTVVGVNDVLTATHVLYSPNNGGWASKVEVYPGADFNGTTSRIEDAPINLGNFTWEVKGWPTQAFANADHNTFSSSESQYDVAVLGLSTPLGVQTGWYGIASGYDNSQWASVLGYSSDATGMMSGSAYVVRDPSASLYFTASANPSDLLSHGSSGGPLYITGQDGKPYVIGVKSAGTSTSNIWADIGLLYDQVKAEISRNDILLTAPYVSQPVADQDATVGQAFKLALASDIFTGGGGSGSLTYSAKLTTGAALPSWLHFDPATKTFSGTPSLADQNTIGIRVTATGINGASASDEFLLSIGAFGTRLAGTAQNDLLRGGADNDYIDGGQGIDTLVLEGPRANYQTTVSGNTTVLKHLSGSGGADTLTSVERLRFADVSVALDVSGTGGQAYRLYQAAFNRAPDASGFGVQMNALDSGWSLVSIAQNFIDSPEFARTYGSLDDRAFVTQLYANVLHRQPDSGGLAFHVNNLAGGMSRAQTLVGFSESPENQAALIGVMQGGMEYVPSASEFRLADGMFGTRLAGTAQNDLLRGGAGNDYIDGGQGIDTLMLEGPRASYQTTVSGNTTVLKHLSGSGGADTLISVERLRFADVSVALDVSGTGGQAYRLYQAAFNRAPDASGFGVQMNALDSGWSLVSIAQNFIDSPEFARTYGSLDDRAFVTRLYANVLHRQPDSGGLEFHINNLAGGMSRAQTLVGFSESPENQAALIGVIQGGMEYVPVA